MNSFKKVERIKNIFNYVAEKKEFIFDSRKFIDSLHIDFTGKQVLEAGCGQGLAAAFVGSLNASRVVGFDLSDMSIKRAGELTKDKQQITNVDFYVSSIENFNTDEKFDIILSLVVLQYVGDLFYCIDRLCSFLSDKKDSLLIITMSEPTLISRIGKIVQKSLSKLPESTIPVVIRGIAVLLKPFNLSGKRHKSGESGNAGSNRPLENFIRESVCSPIYNLKSSKKIKDYLVNKGYEVDVRAFMDIKGLYTIIARRQRV